MLKIFLFLFPLISYSAPTINTVSGNFCNGEKIIITGVAFGSTGPNVILYDNFTGTPGEIIKLAATMGSWSGLTQIPPTYISDDNNVAGLLVDGINSKQLNINFTPTQEFFLSFRVKIPSGYHFPNSAAPGSFAPDSAWKLAWIMDGPKGYLGNDDIVIPTWPNGTYFYIGGNDNAFPSSAANGWVSTIVGRPGTNTNWFSFSGWNRATTYIKAGADPVADNGIIWFQGMSSEFGQKSFVFTDRHVFDGPTNDGDDAISQWTRINISGWHRTNGTNAAFDNKTRAIYDDVYLATGNNARARIEIGDKPTYAACTKLALLTPDSWNNNSITATVRLGEFTNGNQIYLYVIDTLGNPSAVGYPIVLNTNKADQLNPPAGFNQKK